MLHHVPSSEQRDTLFAEILRMLRPGGVLAVEDSLHSPELRDLHQGDSYIPVDPRHLAARLATAGYSHIDVTTNEYAVRFHAANPGIPTQASHKSRSTLDFGTA